MSNEALCQDCLRPQPAHETNEGICTECGGQTCSCPRCQGTLRQLRSGERDWQKLRLQSPIVDWSEKDGATSAPKVYPHYKGARYSFEAGMEVYHHETVGMPNVRRGTVLATHPGADTMLVWFDGDAPEEVDVIFEAWPADEPVLTPDDERWDEFTERLEGPEGCDFAETSDDDGEKRITWRCNGGMDKTYSRRILEDMAERSYASLDVEATLQFFNVFGGHCDCEVLFNVEESFGNVSLSE